jgi:hypothetical protein
MKEKQAGGKYVLQEKMSVCFFDAAGVHKTIFLRKIDSQNS